jgi:uncharacterized membrane protein
MIDLFWRLTGDAHAALSHFPLALLVVGVALDFVARRRPNLAFTAWIMWVLGAVGAVISTVSGLIAHLPYEEAGSAAVQAIEIHQYLAFATTAVFVALTVWRWRSRRRDLSRSQIFAMLSVVGVAVLLLTGFYGGQLANYGVGVDPVTPQSTTQR